MVATYKKNILKSFLLLCNIYTIKLIFSWDLIINNNNININYNFFKNTIYNIQWNLYLEKIIITIDNLSLIFIILTCLIFYISTDISDKELYFKKNNYYCINIILIFICLIFCFISYDLFIFYIFFEFLTIPTFFLIFLSGKKYTKIRASILFLVYSFTSSIFIALAIYLKINYNIFDLFYINNFNQSFLKSINYIFFNLLLLGFIIKIPLMPFHVWLPEAHAETPTAISVILAAIILKLGGYGILRFTGGITSLLYNINYLYIYCILGGIISALFCIRKNNIKQLIAYMSVSHMSFSMLGLLSGNKDLILGGIVAMVQHTLITSVFFMIAGLLYFNFNTYNINIIKNNIKYFKNLIYIILLICIINLEIPLTGGFIGKYAILNGLKNSNKFIYILLLLLILITMIYTVWLLSSINNGSTGDNSLIFIGNNLKIIKKEYYIYMYILILLNFFLGLKFNIFLKIEKIDYFYIK